MSYLGIDRKTEIIMESIKESTGIHNWGPKFEEELLEGITKGLEEINELQPTRTIPEVQRIIDAVRSGLPVQVDYVDTAIEDDYVGRACW